MTNPAAGFLKKLRQDKADARDAEDEKQKLAWHQWRKPAKSPHRRARRIASADQARVNKRFQRARAQQLQEVANDWQKRAVAVLAEIEARADVPAGTLRQQLVDDQKLEDRAYTPMEVLQAFGIDEQATLELYEALQDPTSDEAARFAKDGLLDSERLAAVTS